MNLLIFERKTADTFTMTGDALARRANPSCVSSRITPLPFPGFLEPSSDRLCHHLLVVAVLLCSGGQGLFSERHRLVGNGSDS